MEILEAPTTPIRGDWSSKADDFFNVSSLNEFVNNEVDFGTSWKTLITGSGVSQPLTVTISGLEADGIYNLAFVTGGPREASGAWLDVTTTNSYKESNQRLESGAQFVAVNSPTAVTITEIKADENGTITLNFSSSGAHSATINALAIASVVPEPATASLSLLGLAALMMRRRRA